MLSAVLQLTIQTCCLQTESYFYVTLLFKLNQVVGQNSTRCTLSERWVGEQQVGPSTVDGPRYKDFYDMTEGCTVRRVLGEMI